MPAFTLQAHALLALPRARGKKKYFVVRPFDCNSLPTRKKEGIGVVAFFVLSRTGSLARVPS